MLYNMEGSLQGSRFFLSFRLSGSRLLFEVLQRNWKIARSGFSLLFFRRRPRGGRVDPRGMQARATPTGRRTRMSRPGTISWVPKVNLCQ